MTPRLATANVAYRGLMDAKLQCKLITPEWRCEYVSDLFLIQPNIPDILACRPFSAVAVALSSICRVLFLSAPPQMGGVHAPGVVARMKRIVGRRQRAGLPSKDQSDVG